MAAELPGKVVEIAFEPGGERAEGGPADPPGHQLGRGPAFRRRRPGEADPDRSLTATPRCCRTRSSPRPTTTPPSPTTSRQRPRPTTSAPSSARRRSAPPSAAVSASGRSTSARYSAKEIRSSPCNPSTRSIVNFALPQQHLAQLRPGLPVRVTCDALPGVTIEGRITAMNPLVDAETRNIQVQATVANRGGKAPARHVRQRGGRPPGPAEGACHSRHRRALRPVRRLGLRRRR